MSDPRPPFVVTITAPCRAAMRDLYRRARQASFGRLVRNMLLNVERNLTDNPWEWGEPYNNLTSLNAVRFVRTATDLGFRFEYLVHRERSVVIWIGVEALGAGPADGV